MRQYEHLSTVDGSSRSALRLLAAFLRTRPKIAADLQKLPIKRCTLSQARQYFAVVRAPTKVSG